MHPQHPNAVRKPNSSNFAAKVILAALVFGVPLGTKLILQSARAASSQPIAPTQPMVAPRHDHTATALSDGRVLLVGGVNTNGAVASAEIYNPATKSFLPAPDMAVARARHSATLLTNGLVLVAGGVNGSGVLNSAEMYDPAPGAFRLAGYLTSPRSSHSAIVLSDGRVLIAGGDDAGTAELFDPADETFHALPSPLTEIRWGLSSTLFSDNNVLLAGGSTGETDSLELFNPLDLSFTRLPFPLATPHAGHAAVPTLDGKLLLIGGNTNGTIEELDPATFQVRTVAVLNSAESTSVGLANGKTLVLLPEAAFLFTSGTNTFESLTNSASLQRAGATTTELPTDNKRILVAGGISSSNELFIEATLFNPARIQTDQDDYPPYSFVDITGVGFLPGEAVSNQIVQVAGPAPGTAYDAWGEVADTNGNFTTSWLVFTEDLLNTTLELTAIGQASGLKAVVTFWDGPINAISVDFPANGVTYNAAGYAAGINLGGGSTLPGNNVGGQVKWDNNTTNGGRVVVVSIKRNSDNLYWDGSAFTSASQIFNAAAPKSGTDFLGNGNKLWVYPFSLPADGSYTAQARASQSGETNLLSATDTFTFDSTPPAPPSQPDLTAASDTGASNTDDITTDSTPTFTGTTDGSTTSVTIYVDGVSNVTGTASAYTSGGITTTTLTAGNHSITATAWDAAGNESAQSSALTITIVPTPPATPDLQTASDTGTSTTDNYTSDNTPTFTVGSVSSGNTVTIYANGNPVGSLVASGTSATITTSALTDGVYSITAKQSAGAYSSDASGALSVTIDTTPPAAPSIPDLTAATDSGCSSTDNLTTNAAPIFTGTAETGSTVRILTNGVQAATGTAAAYASPGITLSSLSAGTYSITATATDIAGNLSAASGALSVTILDSVTPNGIGTAAITSISGSAATNLIVTLTSGVPVGDTVIVTVAMDPSTATVTLRDNKGNTYTKDADVTNSTTLTSGVRTLVFSAPLTAPLLAGDRITNNFATAVTAKAASAFSVNGLVSVSRVDKTSTATNATANTTPNSGSTALTTQADEFLVGAIGVEDRSVSFTPASSFLTLPQGTVDGGSDGASITIQPTYRVVNATGNYTASGTLGGSTPNARWAAAIVTYKIAVPGVVSVVRASSNPTCANTVDFTVTFSESVLSVDSSDFALATSGVSGASILGVSGSGSNYTVTVNTGTGSGTVGLNVVANACLFDSDAMLLGGSGGNSLFTGESYNVDKSGPSITCPSNQANNTAPGQCSAVVNYPAPTTTGGCAPVSVNCSPASGSTFQKGATTVTCTANDGNGNTASCSFTVTVNDNENPSIGVCPSNITTSTDAGLCSAVVTYATPTATDNCPGVTVSCTPASGTAFPKGTTTVTCTATDTSSHTASCSFTVMVNDTENPAITCPANLTVQCASDVPAANISAATASDNCGTVTVTHEGDVISGQSCPNKYTITRTYKATDSSGNTATCTQTITVNDTIVPTISAAGADATIDCPATPVFTAPTATDNCAPAPTVVEVSDVTNPGTCAGTYTRTKTWKAVDACGNESGTVSQTITVHDVTKPSITCPANVTIQCASDVPAADISVVTASDSCGTVTVTHEGDVISGQSCPNKYTITRTYKATDACGNFETCTQTITVNDTTAPVISAAGADATIDCPATPVFTAPTATDNCAPAPTVVEVSDVTNPGACAGTYTRTKTWKAVDACGNESGTVSQTITVHDVTKPSITCPANVTVQCASDVPAADISAVTASDSCGTVTVTHEGDVISGQSCPNKYTITRTYKATDACGNFETCTQTITVNDTTAPTISAAGADATIDCPATPVFTAPTATDNCAPAPTVVEVSDVTNPGACAGTYTRTKTWKAVDACGNESGTVSQTITVHDVTKPSITCPANVTVQCAGDVPAADISVVTASDSCGTVTVTHEGDVISGQSCPNKYTITRTYKATDACGNFETCTQTITVNDTTAPVISAAGADATIDCPATPVFTAPTATDNCAPAPTVVEVSDVTNPGTCAGTYTRTKTWKAVDACGNESGTVSQTITVHDVTKPSITCPANVTVQCASDVPAADISAVTASDSCGTVTVTHEGDVISGQTCPNKYTITRTYKATDACGNFETCTQTITVNDTTAPVISAAGADATIDCPATPVFTAPTATDNCAPAPTVVEVSDVTNPGTCAGTYTRTKTWKAVDACGNESGTVSQTITVHDVTKPSITCPANVTVQCASDVPAADISAVTASDSCGTVTVTHEGDVISGQSCPNKYTITRTYKATDACGNFETCTQTITVNDTTAPTISAAGADATIDCPATPVFTAPTATDNCAPAPTVVEVSDVTNPGACAGTYTRTKTWKAVDACGNESGTVSQTITVHDVTKPSITCPANVTVQCAGDVPAADISAVTASDSCGTVTVTHEGDVVSGQSCPNKYTITRTYKATDACGNFETCTQTITVNDTVAPTISAAGADATIDCPATPVFTAPTATDNCAPAPTVVEVSDVTNPGTCAGTYTRTKTWKAVDACGNESGTVSQTITVHDVTKPSITCPANVTVQCASDVPAADISAVTASDSCGTVTVTHEGDVISGQTCPNKYTITRTYKATDACGNFETCTQTITVNDTTAPVISAAGADATIDCPATPVFTAPTATDNCAPAPTVVEVSDVTNPGTCAGTYTRTKTWKAVDACGNESGTVSQTITVHDVTKPSITCPANVTVQCASDVPAADISAVTASDSCGTVTVTHEGDVISGQTCPNKYTITRTYKATDACGNFETCTQTITVNDTTAPVISAAGADATIDCPATPVFTAPTATDNCAPAPTVVEVSDVTNPGTCAGTYTRTKTWKAVDACGNESGTVSQTITVHDITKPSITCPANVTVQCASDVPAADISAVTAIDSCGTVTVTHEGDIVSGQSCPNKYTITRTYKATDACGNFETCTQTITVNDTTAPVISAAGADATIDCPATPVFTAPTATDNCAPAPTVVEVSDVTNPGTCAGTYTRTKTWKAVDACGNESGTVSQTITVQDVTKPVITLNGSPAVAVECHTSYTDAGATASDTCAGTVLVSTSGSVNVNMVGTYTLTYGATDPCGNSANLVTRTVDVVDTTKPVITLNGAADVTVECHTSYTEAGATASDSCAGSLTPTAVSTVDINTVGDYTVTFNVTDPSGNAADTVVRTVHVRDTTKPVISLNGSAVVTVECHTSYTDAGATASDTCAGAVPVSTSGSVNVNVPGSYTITYNATDPSGNHADTISRTVNVVDTTSPTIVCPPDQTAEATGPSGAVVNYPAPSVSDTCDANPTVVCTPPSGSTFPVGTSTVNCTATDASGNMAPCSFQVMVTSAQPPTLACPPDMQMACGQSTDPAHTGTASASATTCSGAVSISYSDAATPANCTGQVGIDRTWTAADACGKTTNGVQHITFVDTTAPVLNGCTNQTVIAACNAPVNFVRPTATDTCSGTVTVTCSPDSGTLMGPGAHTITVTATDACGNTTNRTFTVMVLSPLHVVFDSPLEDDNLANNTTPDGVDATGTPEIVNQFTSGQTIPHKVKLLDCAGNDVTDSVAPLVKVTLDVTERTGGYYSSTVLNNVAETYTGVGDPGSRLVLVDHHFQYNLKTTGYDAGTIKSNAKFFQSVVRVEYLANPGVTVGQENVILESK